MQYQPQFLENLEIFNTQEIKELELMSKDMPLIVFLNSTGEKGLIHSFEFDFVYSSSQIEGNTYDRFETLELLEDGITAGGKKYTDALMILNLRNIYEEMLSPNLENFDISKTTFQYFHKIIAKDLVQTRNLGTMRNLDVRITGTDYTPLKSGDRLNSEIDYVFKQYQNIENPFDRCLYIHHNLAYLQYFEDCNKRVARSMQCLSLLKDNLMPFILVDNYDKENAKELYRLYRRNLLTYYNEGSYAPYKEFFMTNYEKIRQRVYPFTQEFYKNKSIYTIDTKDLKGN